MRMTDAELAEYLNLTPEEAAIVIPKLTPKRRATYDHMRTVAIEAVLWMDGLGPRPRALIDTVKSVKRRRAWK